LQIIRRAATIENENEDEVEDEDDFGTLLASLPVSRMAA